MFARLRRGLSRLFRRIGDLTGWFATTKNNFRRATVRVFSSPSTVHGIVRHIRKVGTTWSSNRSPATRARAVAKYSRTVSPGAVKTPEGAVHRPVGRGSWARTGRSMYPTTFADEFIGSSIAVAPRTTPGAPSLSECLRSGRRYRRDKSKPARRNECRRRCGCGHPRSRWRDARHGCPWRSYLPRESGRSGLRGLPWRERYGLPLGPNLAGKKWLWSDGSYAGILKAITGGVPQPKEYRSPMPPMGGAQLTPDQLSALAAYVWAIGH